MSLRVATSPVVLMLIPWYLNLLRYFNPSTAARQMSRLMTVYSSSQPGNAPSRGNGLRTTKRYLVDSLIRE